MDLSRNIVIEASAGTGKTYTLVQTILRALFEKKLKMDELVALTFTKKAAGEMKERIAAELQKIDSPEARAALEAIDRAAIGTIHSYAFSLLKRFPLQAGVSPAAEVDEKGIRADDLFEEEWPKWMRAQCAMRPATGRNAEDWLKVFAEIEMKDIRELARRLCDFDVPLDALRHVDLPALPIAPLLFPFVSRFREHLLAEGILSNNALLVLARELVAKNPRVRETLKREIRMIFVDEFQDTDPLQGELLLFLAEKEGASAKKWQDVKLEPGKLFIVGDPKQSIYRFRGADIAAYTGITQMVMNQGGECHSLKISHRSQEQIVHLANAAFSSLIKEKHPISPAYQALEPKRKREDGGHHEVELRLAVSPDEETQSSEDALIREAEDAAAWIASKKGIAFKDIAIIFRSTPAMSPFIDALRRRDIPFVVEGERYFYRTPEVTDVLNLLRVIENPKDRISLVGVLRSPLGGYTDPEIVELKMADWKKKSPILDLIDSLRTRAKREPLKSVLNHVYEDTFLLELAARSYHRDQTIANLLKLKRLMESFAEEGETSLAGLLSKIARFMEDDRLEGESPLADETYDAVRLLTIHKAKGLEFPVVWLPGLHRGRQPNRAGEKIRVRYDWSSGRLGVKIGKELRNADDLALEEEARARDEAEERRILYVAMTRARDRLILSGGIQLKRPYKDSFLNLLAGAWGLNLEAISDGDAKIADTTLSIRRLSPEIAEPKVAKSVKSRTWLDTIKPAEFAKRWQKREAALKRALETPLVATPTSVTSSEQLAPSTEGKRVDSLLSACYSVLQLGTLLHRFLEAWDFTCEKCDMPAKLRMVANHYFASLGLLKEPFPDPRKGDKTANPPELTEAVDEAQRILADFIGSAPYEEIQESTILGREVPFLSGAEPLMRGVMDILYQTPEGQIFVGDYKSDQVPRDYSKQGEIYVEAVQRALGKKVIFKVIPLRELSPTTLPRKFVETPPASLKTH